MRIQKRLIKLGIVKEKEVSHEVVNSVAHYVADRITTTFLSLQTQYNEILAKMLNCKMYYAKIPPNMSRVNYIHEDDSIYIDENINVLEPNEQLFHEFIHYLQVIRGKKGKIKKMGLCDFNDFAIKGLGLNEAFVQYMSSKIMNNEKEKTEIYGIKLQTISPNSYPVLTNLMEQMVYLFGEDVIIRYAMNVDEEFDTVFFNTFEEKGNQIIKNFDKILDLKNKLITNSKEKIKRELEEKIKNIYEETQKIITIKYYKNISLRLVNEKEIDNYIEKFLNSKGYFGEENNQDFNTVTFFEEYKKIVMSELDQRLMKINKEKQRHALVVYNNKLINFLKKKISYFFN